MKKLKLLLLSILMVVLNSIVYGQSDTSKYYIVTKTDGKKITGKILSQDAREVLINTPKLGQIIIPKHEIDEIKECSAEEVNDSNELFSTRYFLTTNGFPMKKGESYVQISLYGIDYQAAITNRINVGIMTSWFAIPIIGTIKYSKQINENLHLGTGLLLGTGSWGAPSFKLALPYGVATYGNTSTNITLSLGYGSISNKFDTYDYLSNTYTSKNQTHGNFLASIGAKVKLSEKLSFVFDSFYVPNGSSTTTLESDINGSPIYTTTKNDFLLIIPGLRYQTSYSKAFQFGFAGLSYGGSFAPVPIPMVQWYRKI